MDNSTFDFRAEVYNRVIDEDFNAMMSMLVVSPLFNAMGDEVDFTSLPLGRSRCHTLKIQLL